ncbi:MAG: group-specific protein [Elusimicrobia bacterium]|nr:MAG: group-specific protein [Elusimicrobiota bacterium]KAF0153977.1 MAG: group-specific protein [Elusimicrobiota bacterium]
MDTNGICVYHIRQPDFKGTRLYPLNRLKTVYPDVYARCVKKYEGREWLTRAVIEYFDCIWNDVLHFSLMHPSLIYRGLSETGFDHHKVSREWFKIPLLDVLSPDAALYRNEEEDDKDGKVREFPRDEFEPVTSARVKELSGMPDRNLRYYRRSFEKKRPPVMWGYAPHLLYKGELDVSSYKVFDWKAAAPGVRAV